MGQKDRTQKNRCTIFLRSMFLPASADGEGFEASRQYVEKLEASRNFGTETTRAALMPNLEAQDPLLQEIASAWSLADDAQRESILEAVRLAMLRR